MVQPFIEFEEQYIDRLLGLNKTLLVTQSYHRHRDLFGDVNKKGILVTDYDDPGFAKIHANAVSADPFGAVINLKNEAHRRKLIEMLKPHSAYKVFWSILRTQRDVEKLKERIGREYRWNIKNYIDNRTNWEIGRDSAVEASVELVFGELFVLLKHRNERIKLKLVELESH